MLGISPHTVDQRIMLARAKLQAGTRSEVAQAYRRLLAEQGNISVSDIYHRSVYGSPEVAEPEESGQGSQQEAADGHALGARPAEPEGKGSSPRQRVDLRPSDAVQAYYHVLPEAFDGRGGTLLRLGAIAMITVFLTLMILGGLAIYSELAHMLDS